MKTTTRDVLERLMEAMNAHDADAVAALMTDDVRFWEPTYPEPRIGREAVREEMAGFFAMLPDIQFKAEATAWQDGVVLSEFSYTATYEGRTIGLRECSVSRIEGDRFAEVRVYFDRLTLLRQLGMPAG